MSHVTNSITHMNECCHTNEQMWVVTHAHTWMQECRQRYECMCTNAVKIFLSEHICANAHMWHIPIAEPLLVMYQGVSSHTKTCTSSRKLYMCAFVYVRFCYGYCATWQGSLNWSEVDLIARLASSFGLICVWCFLEGALYVTALPFEEAPRHI